MTNLSMLGVLEIMGIVTLQAVMILLLCVLYLLEDLRVSYSVSATKTQKWVKKRSASRIGKFYRINPRRIPILEGAIVGTIFILELVATFGFGQFPFSYLVGSHPFLVPSIIALLIVGLPRWMRTGKESSSSEDDDTEGEHYGCSSGHDSGLVV